MDKGWGLTLDSSSSSSSLSFLPSPTKLSHHQRMFPPLGFPVNLSRTTRDDDHTSTAPSPPSDDNRVVVGEVDFFSDRNSRLSSPSLDHPIPQHVQTNTNISVNIKEISRDGTSPTSKCNNNIDTGLQLLTANTGSDQSTVDDGVSSHAEDKRAKTTELAQLQEDLQRMKAENQKLKEMLSHVNSNYTNLQMQLVALMQQQQNQRTESTEHEVVQGIAEEKKDGGGTLARKFLDLGPSGTAEVDDQISNSSSDERTRSSTPQNNNIIEVGTRDYVRNNNGKNEMDKKETDDQNSESQGWDPNKLQKLNPSNATDQSTTEATMRKARVSVRARSEAPMISDGCQWRKYGQKMAKGNPCPRAYYRCTMAVGCPVRKQVQRCAEDRTILITTYEGSHNHLLPPAAMAMASTTAAAASILLSGSTSSGDGIMNPNLLARAILPPYSSSMATLSASAPFPTVTLDLTHNPNALQLPTQSPATPFPAGLGHPHNLPQVIAQALYNQSQFSSLHLSQHVGSSQLPPTLPLHPTQQPSLPDTVSAATAAITADPNFTAVLAAAISSIIGSANATNTNNNTNPNIINSTTISGFSGN